MNWSNYSHKHGYNPSYPFIRPFIEVLSSFVTGRGPTLYQLQFRPISIGFEYLIKHQLPIYLSDIYTINRKPPSKKLVVRGRAYLPTNLEMVIEKSRDSQILKDDCLLFGDGLFWQLRLVPFFRSLL